MRAISIVVASFLMFSLLACCIYLLPDLASRFLAQGHVQFYHDLGDTIIDYLCGLYQIALNVDGQAIVARVQSAYKTGHQFYHLLQAAYQMCDVIWSAVKIMCSSRLGWLVVQAFKKIILLSGGHMFGLLAAV